MRLAWLLLFLALVPAAGAVTRGSTPRADAESAFVAARFDEADRGYAAILARAPHDTLALFRRGQIALFANRLADAKRFGEHALAAGATPIRVAALLGEVAYRQDDYATAAAQFKLFTGKEPSLEYMRTVLRRALSPVSLKAPEEMQK